MRQIVAKLLIVASAFSLLSACGYKELPQLKKDAEVSFKEMLTQYRLRADLVPHFVKVFETQKLNANQTKLVAGLKKAHQNAIGIDIPVDRFDEKNMFRMQSFQYELSRRLNEMLLMFDKVPAVSANGEYQSLKAQLDRYEGRIAVARQEFMQKGPKYNASLGKTPQKWVNQVLFKFKPIPVLENSAHN